MPDEKVTGTAGPKPYNPSKNTGSLWPERQSPTKIVRKRDNNPILMQSTYHNLAVAVPV